MEKLRVLILFQIGPVDLGPVKQIPSFIWKRKPVEDPEQGRFSGSVIAPDNKTSPLLYTEREVLQDQRLFLAVGKRYVFQFDQTHFLIITLYSRP